MTATLKIIATPIGNIRDISLRAIDELSAADLILAEDTRHTKQLLRALNISLKEHVRVISCDTHREEERAQLVLLALQKNERVVLVSDAGCPAISDPGSLLAQAVVAAQARIEVIPGPSALTAAIMGAALDTTRFAFLGFLPKRKSLREKLISSAARAELAIVIYESPLRVFGLLDELYMLLGARRVVVARELTKIYETFHRGILGQSLEPPFVDKGECVVVVEAGSFLEPEPLDQKQELKAFIEEAHAQGASAKDIVQALIKRFPMKKKAALNKVLEVLGKTLG